MSETQNWKSPREIRNAIAAHLLLQRKKAVDTFGQCRYRTSGGLQCAVGCLIQQKCYNELIENELISTLVFFLNKDIRSESAVTALLDSLECSGINVRDKAVSAVLIRGQRIHDEYDAAAWPKLIEKWIGEDLEDL